MPKDALAILDHCTAAIGGGYAPARQALNAALKAAHDHSEVAVVGLVTVSAGEALGAAFEAVAASAAVDVIRSLGFVGGTHYCADCMNEFHADLGQHEPGCGVLADLLAERNA